ncbi:hypothetical protein AB0758_00645 [Tolypothrix bouteillei VB521301_2]|uniref:hypothetical protein n=1 Tax=Tolypothrix bouteillei TaxID=1246981 RepID=UPI0038B54B3C
MLTHDLLHQSFSAEVSGAKKPQPEDTVLSVLPTWHSYEHQWRILYFLRRAVP